jgi:UDP-arabinose 4-epimerase
MNVLVTGGAGYIGSHTAKALAKAGHQPVVYDNLSRGHSWAVQWGPLVRGDLADTQRLSQTLRKYSIGAVIHFAAYAYIGESMSEPGLYFENNSVNSMRLLEAMRLEGIDRIVFSSTCATYGIPQQVPISETDAQTPVNPYGESKLFVEKMLRWYGDVHATRWVALRYFNACGADPDGDIGELHNPETHLIPLVLEAALDRSKPISIFGTDYPTPDGTAIRDYIHVADLADAHVRALHHLDRGGPSQAFNLGTGRGYSVHDVVTAVAQTTGRTPGVRHGPRRSGDPAELVANPQLARQVLGWHPSHSGLNEIIQTAWDWRTSGRLSAFAIAG